MAPRLHHTRRRAFQGDGGHFFTLKRAPFTLCRSHPRKCCLCAENPSPVPTERGAGRSGLRAGGSCVLLDGRRAAGPGGAAAGAYQPPRDPHTHLGRSASRWGPGVRGPLTLAGHVAGLRPHQSPGRVPGVTQQWAAGRGLPEPPS